MCPRLPATLFGIVLSLSLAAPALAADGFGPRLGFGSVSGIGGPGWHGPRHDGRPRFRLGGYGPRVAVVVNNIFVPPPPPPYREPTVLDLPVGLGIREAKPAQAAIYVLNDGVRQTAAPVRLSSGPRIIDLDGPDTVGSTEPVSGARIIHLTVPVGRP